MPMDTTKYNHNHQFLIKFIGLHTSGQDIDSLYFCKISASILLDKISILFTFAKYRLVHTSGQDTTYSSEVHDKGDPFSKLLE